MVRPVSAVALDFDHRHSSDFRTGHFSALGKGSGEGIRNFKSAMKDPGKKEKKDEPPEEKKS